MIYPDIPLENWLKKYDLEVTEKICAHCEGTFQTTIPILIKGYAGLETPQHGCPRQFAAAVFTPTSFEKTELWQKIIK